VNQWWGSSGISWTICKSFVPGSSQTGNHASTSSLNFLKGRLLFLMPNQQATASMHWRQNKNANQNVYKTSYTHATYAQQSVTFSGAREGVFLTRCLSQHHQQLRCQRMNQCVPPFQTLGHCFFFNNQNHFMMIHVDVPFSALTMLVGWQEGCPGYKNSVPLLSPKVPFQNKWRKKTKGKPATKMEEVVGVTYAVPYHWFNIWTHQ